MVDRLTVDEFFDAMRRQMITPLVDTPTARRAVAGNVRALCSGYKIRDRWPVLDLESAYEGYLNAQDNLLELHSAGYRGTINLRGYDDHYDLDEWFGDFTTQWLLIDTPSVRRRMLSLLGPGSRWRSPQLYEDSSFPRDLRGVRSHTIWLRINQ